ncbi:hypothetical protein [Streptomyces sp. NPDC017890]|uniref:hypothetical protein n=1 Tax=Streptomyces sp. NPDC017890 TaxID=3365015 RepID=UPI0037A97F0E
MSTLALFVLLIGIVVGSALVGSLGVLVYRRPALKGPTTVTVTAADVRVACAVGVFGVAQASTQGGGASPGMTVPPTGRWTAVVGPAVGLTATHGRACGREVQREITVPVSELCISRSKGVSGELTPPSRYRTRWLSMWSITADTACR